LWWSGTNLKRGARLERQHSMLASEHFEEGEDSTKGIIFWGEQNSDLVVDRRRGKGKFQDRLSNRRRGELEIPL